ncbi:MAG: hypothetical protein AAF108_04060 [Planctomycetota bacterium]
MVEAMRWALISVFGAIVCGGTVAQAGATLGEPRRATLIGPGLVVETAPVASLDRAGVTPVGGGRRDDLLAVWFEAGNGTPRSLSGSPARLRLTDGTVLEGDIDRSGARPDAVSWLHPVFGSIVISLDRASWYEIDRTGAGFGRPPRDLEADVVRFNNGDSVSGFVVSVGPEVELESDDGRVSRFPLDLVSAIGIANPDEPATRAMLVTDSGSVVRVESVRVAGSGFSIDVRTRSEAGLISWELPQDRVLGIVYQPHRLVALSSLEPVSVEPLGTGLVRRKPVVVGEERPLLGSDVLFSGPMSASYACPGGSSVFACVAEMPESARLWGDCDFVVDADGVELGRWRLHGGGPRVDVRVELPTGTERLGLRVAPGRRGPVSDRVVLKWPMIEINAAGEP